MNFSSLLRRLKKTLASYYGSLQTLLRRIRIRSKLSSSWWLRRLKRRTLASYSYKITKGIMAFNPWKCLLVFLVLGPTFLYSYDYFRRLIISKDLYWAVGSTPVASREGQNFIIESMIRWKTEALPPGFDKWLNLGHGFSLTRDGIRDFLKINFKFTKPSRWGCLLVALLFSVKPRLLSVNVGCYRRWSTEEKDHMEIHGEAVRSSNPPSWLPDTLEQLTRNDIMYLFLITTVLLLLLCLKLWIQAGLITTSVVLSMCGYSTPFLLVVPLWFILLVIIHVSFYLSDGLILAVKRRLNPFKRWLGRQ